MDAGAASAAEAAVALAQERAAALLATPEYREVLREMEYGLVIDMDDTLISNQILFDHSRRAVVSELVALDSQGRSAEEVGQLHRETDNALVAKYGYTPHRWYRSAFQTARTVKGEPLSPEERARVETAASIAMGLGDELPGCSEALQVLQEEGVNMVLKTKGDRRKQEQKLAKHRFDRFFGDRIHIVDRKNADTFREITDRYQMDKVMSLGDSALSDIAPALENGFDGILLERGAGAGSNSYEDMNGREFTRAGSLPEALVLMVDRIRAQRAS